MFGRFNSNKKYDEMKGQNIRNDGNSTIHIGINSYGIWQTCRFEFKISTICGIKLC